MTKVFETSKVNIFNAENLPLPISTAKERCYPICALAFSDSSSYSSSIKDRKEEFCTFPHEFFRLPRLVRLSPNKWRSFSIPRRTSMGSVDGDFANECIMSYIMCIMRECEDIRVFADTSRKAAHSCVIANFKRKTLIKMPSGWSRMNVVYADSTSSFSDMFSEALLETCEMDPLESLSLVSSINEKGRLPSNIKNKGTTLQEWDWLGKPLRAWGMREWKEWRMGNVSYAAR